MTEKIIELLKDKQGFKDVKLVYSSKEKMLLVFTSESIYAIENIIENPKIKEINLKSENHKNGQDFDRLILHQKNENQLIAISNNSIYFVSNLREFSDKKQLAKLNINDNKEILSIKFSYFDNCFGILNKDRTFAYYIIKENNKCEEICFIKDLITDYVDFNFCPLFSKGFEIFMTFFMTKDGEINLYGPFFPNEFFIPKEYFFNMENYLIYQLSIIENENRNNPKNTIYCLSLNVIDDLKKTIIEEKSDKDNDFIKISDKMKVFNSTFRKREIKIRNNFLVNNCPEVVQNNYKQIHILNKRPLTILRISEKNDIDLIMIGEEIMPLELAQTGNFIFNAENSINNFFIEFIRLNNTIENNKIKIFQYNNEELFIKTQNSLFLIKIPYLNKLKTIAEENIKDIPNKMYKTNIIKLLKWKNEQDEKKKKKEKEEKYINLKDILIIPDLQKLLIFGILIENNKFSPVLHYTLKIKEKNYSEEEKKTDLSNFNNILNQNTEYDTQIKEINARLHENNFIDSSDIINTQLEIDENILKDKNIDFENILNSHMNEIYKTYKNLIQTNEGVFKQKIDIMKYIYNNLSKSQIKLTIDATIKKINDLNKMKEDILEKKKTIEEKINVVKQKINTFEMDDEDLNSYLKILGDYQKMIVEKLTQIDNNIESIQKNIIEIYSFTNLFPGVDLGFNSIIEDNQVKYLEFEKKIRESSKKISQDFPKDNK